MSERVKNLRIDSLVAFEAGVELDDSNDLDSVIFQVHRGVAAHVTKPFDYRCFVLKHHRNTHDTKV